MRIGIKSGCFSLLHAGHIFALRYAASRVDYLIVLTNDDKYVLKKKGSVPIPLKDRMSILAAIKYVNEVHWFPQSTEELWIGNFKSCRLYADFGQDAKLVVFHTIELANSDSVPAQSLADEIIFIPRIDSSVSDIFATIKGHPSV